MNWCYKLHYNLFSRSSFDEPADHFDFAFQQHGLTFKRLTRRRPYYSKNLSFSPFRLYLQKAILTKTAIMALNDVFKQETESRFKSHISTRIFTPNSLKKYETNSYSTVY